MSDFSARLPIRSPGYTRPARQGYSAPGGRDPSTLQYTRPLPYLFVQTTGCPSRRARMRHLVMSPWTTNNSSCTSKSSIPLVMGCFSISGSPVPKCLLSPNWTLNILCGCLDHRDESRLPVVIFSQFPVWSL